MSGREKLSEEEAALYDRQIRLWGLEAQARLKNAKILLLGLSPVSCEIIKNIVLCGVNTLILCDDKRVSHADIESSFLFDESHLNAERNKSALVRARSMNEMVTIKCEDNVSKDFLVENYSGYDEIIIALDFCDSTFKDWLSYVQEFCSQPNRPRVHCVVSFGMHAVGFADLGHYAYDGNDLAVTSSVKKESVSNSNESLSVTVNYPSLKIFFETDWRNKASFPYAIRRMPKGFFLTLFISSLNGPLSSQSLTEKWPEFAERMGFPVTTLSDEDFESCFGDPVIAVNAIMGGIIAQEIIQGLSHKGKPKGNWYFLDGRTCEASILWLPVQA